MNETIEKTWKNKYEKLKIEYDLIQTEIIRVQKKYDQLLFQYQECVKTAKHARKLMPNF